MSGAEGPSIIGPKGWQTLWAIPRGRRGAGGGEDKRPRAKNDRLVVRFSEVGLAKGARRETLRSAQKNNFDEKRRRAAGSGSPWMREETASGIALASLGTVSAREASIPCKRDDVWQLEKEDGDLRKRRVKWPNERIIASTLLGTLCWGH